MATVIIIWQVGKTNVNIPREFVSKDLEKDDVILVLVCEMF
jgi:hypothetical protein